MILQDDIVYAKDPAPAFYHDIPENEQHRWVDEPIMDASHVSELIVSLL